MLRFSKFLTLFFTLLLVTGCVSPQHKGKGATQAQIDKEIEKQRKLYIERLHEEEGKLHNIANRILSVNEDLCGELADKVVISFGFKTVTLNEYPTEYKKVAKEYFGLTPNNLVVEHVFDNTDAKRQGLKTGDEILAIAGVEVPQKLSERDEFDETLSKKLKNINIENKEKISVVIRRDGATAVRKIDPYRSCNYNIKYYANDQKNAYANGRDIAVYRGLLTSVDDISLASVVAHELAHSVMGHAKSKGINRAVGGFFGVLMDAFAISQGVDTGGYWTDKAGDTAVQTYSQEFEEEADYVGTYFMARAGYDLDKVLNTWREMAVAMDLKSVKPEFLSSHPSSAERFLAMQKTIEEIREKRKADKPIKPELSDMSEIIEDISEEIEGAL